jgi:hypothetical protein
MNQTRLKAPGPTLRFSPTAWAKLLYLRDLGITEVGGFGVTPADDLLYVQEIALVKQVCSAVSVVFEDASVADFFDEQIDRGLRPEQFARIWIHTHPAISPDPSGVDEETFARVFGECNWAVMFIIAEDGRTYARLGFHTGPGGALEIPVEVDFSMPFAASDEEAWEREHLANVQVDDVFTSSGSQRRQTAAMLHEDDFRQEDPWDTRWTVNEPYWEEEALLYE